MRTPRGCPLVLHPMDIKHGLAPGTWEAEHPWEAEHSVPRRQRKPSIRRMVAAAEKIGKTVTSVTMPDGTELHFGELAPTEASNPWLADLTKVKQ